MTTTDTPVDTAARAVIAAAIAHTAAVDAYRMHRVDLVDVRAARADVAAAHRTLIATPGSVFDADLYLRATHANRVTARLCRYLIARHIDGNPDR